MTRSREAILCISFLLVVSTVAGEAAEPRLDVYERTFHVPGEPEELRWLDDGALAVRLRSGEWRRLDRSSGLLGDRPLSPAPARSPSSARADSASHEVIIELDSERSRRWGSFGARTGQFCRPSAARRAGNRIYVADTGNHRIQVFDLDGEFLYRFGRHQLKPRQGEGHLHYPADVLIDRDGGRAYVAEPWEDRIQVFRARTGEDPPADARLDWERAELPAHFGEHWAIRGSWLLISEPEAERVALYKLRGREQPVRVSELGGVPGDSLGRWRGPAEIIALPGTHHSEFLVHDRGNHRWQVVRVTDEKASLRFDRRLLEVVSAVRWQEAEGDRRLVLEGDRIGLVAPGSVTWMSRRGEALATEALPEGVPREFVSAGHHRLMITREIATPRRSFAHFGSRSELGWRWSEPVPLPREIASAAAEDPDFARELAGGSSGFDSVLWRLVDRPLDRVLWIDHRGRLVRSFGARGEAAGQFHHLRATLRDGEGLLWALETGNHRVQVFDRSGGLILSFGSRNYLAPLKRESDRPRREEER